jgi:hypothetical protein
MPQLENKELLEKVLKSTIGVIARRTSEGYANVIVGKCVRDLSEKFFFLKFVHIQGTQFQEVFEIISIDSEIQAVNPKDIGKAIVSIYKRLQGTWVRILVTFLSKKLRTIYRFLLNLF